MRLATGRGGLLFDLKDDVHDRIREIGFRWRAETGEIRFGGHPAGLQAGERRRGDGSWGLFRSTPVLLSTFGETFFGLGEGGSDAAIAFGVGDVTEERIGAENEFGGCEELDGSRHPADSH